DDARRAAVLVDLDYATGAHHPKAREGRMHEGLRLVRIAVEHDDGVARPCVADVPAELAPVEVVVGRVERQLAAPGGRGLAVERDAGAVGSAVAHLDEHRGEVLTEPRLELGRLAEETDDSAHAQ